MRTVEKTRGTSRWHAISVVCFLPTKKQREARLLKITTGHATIRLKGASDVWRVAGGGERFAVAVDLQLFITRKLSGQPAIGSLIARDNYC